MDDQVGRNVKQLREALGMSQAEVAEGMTKDGCAGFYPQTILKVEKGTRSLKFTEADSLARVLKVPMSALLNPGSPEAWAGFKVTRMFRDLDQMEARLQDAQHEAEQGQRRGAQRRRGDGPDHDQGDEPGLRARTGAGDERQRDEGRA